LRFSLIILILIISSETYSQEDSSRVANSGNTFNKNVRLNKEEKRYLKANYKELGSLSIDSMKVRVSTDLPVISQSALEFLVAEAYRLFLDDQHKKNDMIRELNKLEVQYSDLISKINLKGKEAERTTDPYKRSSLADEQKKLLNAKDKIVERIKYLKKQL
jgi:hypothetical protein